MSEPAWSAAAEGEVPQPARSATPESTWPQQLSHDATLRVGDVLAALRHEFPSLSPSKLRFLDAQGLVTPSRTGSGYRLYSTSDVERLRYVLRQQRDHYAPLHVIGARLGELDGGRAHEPLALSLAGSPLSEDAPIDEVAVAAGANADVVVLLVAEGAVASPAPGLVPRAAVPLIAAAARYLDSGADVRELRALLRTATREAEAAAASSAPLRRRDGDADAAAAVASRAEAAAATYAAAVRWAAATPW